MQNNQVKVVKVTWNNNVPAVGNTVGYLDGSGNFTATGTVTGNSISDGTGTLASLRDFVSHIIIKSVLGSFRVEANTTRTLYLQPEPPSGCVLATVICATTDHPTEVSVVGLSNYSTSSSKGYVCSLYNHTGSLVSGTLTAYLLYLPA